MAAFNIKIDSKEKIEALDYFSAETHEYLKDLFDAVGTFNLESDKGKTLKINRDFDREAVVRKSSKDLWAPGSKVDNLVKELNKKYPHNEISTVYAGSGSKGDALSTAQQEIATGLFFAAALHGKEIETLEDFKHYASISEIKTKESIETIYNNIDKSWLASFKASSAAFKKEFTNPELKLYYGSPKGSVLGNLYARAQELLKLAGFTFDINKWSPADIWFMTNTGAHAVNDIIKSTTIDEFNIKLQKAVSDKIVVPLSLKKSDGKSASVTHVNLERDKTGKSLFSITEKAISNIKITNVGTTIDKLAKAKDIYIRCKIDGLGDMSMQCRTFQSDGTNFSVEIKGKNANHGKIGIKVVQELLNSVAKNNKHATFFKDYKDAHIKFGAKYDKVLVTDKKGKSKLTDAITHVHAPKDDSSMDFYHKWKTLQHIGTAKNIIIESEQINSPFLNYAGNRLLEESVAGNAAFNQTEYDEFSKKIHSMSLDQRISKYLAVNIAYHLATLENQEQIKKMILDLFRMCSSQHQVSAPFYKIM